MSFTAKPNHPAYDPSRAFYTGSLFRFVQHKYNCDWLQPMWHKGPCDCGLKELVQSLPEDLLAVLVEASDHVRATVEGIQQDKERDEREAKEKAP